ENTRAFLEPRIAPGLYHRLRLFFIETCADQYDFEFARKPVNRLIERGAFNLNFAFEQIVNNVADFSIAIFKQYELRDVFLPRILHNDPFAFELRSERQIETSQAAIEKKLFVLRFFLAANANGRGINLARGVVMLRAALNGEGNRRVRQHCNAAPLNNTAIVARINRAGLRIPL